MITEIIEVKAGLKKEKIKHYLELKSNADTEEKEKERMKFFFDEVNPLFR